jgi:hypothetical protein
MENCFASDKFVILKNYYKIINFVILNAFNALNNLKSYININNLLSLDAF